MLSCLNCMKLLRKLSIFRRSQSRNMSMGAKSNLIESVRWMRLVLWFDAPVHTCRKIVAVVKVGNRKDSPQKKHEFLRRFWSACISISALYAELLAACENSLAEHTADVWNPARRAWYRRYYLVFRSNKKACLLACNIIHVSSLLPLKHSS